MVGLPKNPLPPGHAIPDFRAEGAGAVDVSAHAAHLLLAVMAHMGVADQKRTGKFTASSTRVLEYLKQVLGLLPHVSMQDD